MDADGDAGLAPAGLKGMQPINVSVPPSITEADEEGDHCRICRGDGSDDQPLFYPCKCSGSIKFVHQDCLMEWLSHSQKKYCELCKTPFTFTKLYNQSMPPTLPLPLFIRQILIHTIRGTLKWLRFSIVGFVWLCWLPWSIRQVWRALFWIADGGWAMPGVEDTLTLVDELSGTFKTPLHDVPLLSSRTSVINDTIVFPPGRALKAWLAKPFSLPSTDLMFVRIVELLYPNLTRWISELISSPSDTPKYSRRNQEARLPSLLSDVSYFKNVSKHPLINNAMIDVVEGQLICLLVVTVFILVFLIREWVINQQPPLNGPDADQGNGMIGLQQADFEQRLIEQRQAIRRRRRGVQEALHQHERRGNAANPLLEDGQRPMAIPRLRERHHTDPGFLATDEANDHQAAAAGAASEPESASTANEIYGASDVATFAPDSRPLLPARNTIGQVTDIRRDIEEASSSQTEVPPAGAFDFSFGTYPQRSPSLADDLAGSSVSADDDHFTLHINQEPELPLLQDPSLVEMPQRDTQQESNTPVDDSGFLPNSAFAPEPFSILSNEPPSLPDPRSREVEAGPATTDLGTAAEAHDFIEIPERPSDEVDTMEDTLNNGEADPNSVWNRLKNWMWNVDDVVPAQQDVPVGDAEQIVNDIGREAPFIPAAAFQPGEGDALIDEQAHQQPPARQDRLFGIDLNADAIEDAEDLDGLLELIGVQGPMAGMLQNMIFSELLITLTIASSVWLPYIWGKIALLIIANPVGMFLRAPVYLTSKAADGIVDLVLFIAGLVLYSLSASFRQLLRGFAYVSPKMGNSVTVSSACGLSLALAKDSGTRLERTLAGAFLAIQPDFPTFSAVSHQALRDSEEKIASAFNVALELFASVMQKPDVELTRLLPESWDWPWPNLPSISSAADFAQEKFIAWTTYIASTDFHTSTKAPPFGPLNRPPLEVWSTQDKLIAIFLGYCLFFLSGYAYLKIARFLSGTPPGGKIEGAVAESLTQAGGVLKVVLIIGIEMIIFPLYCGMLLDLALLPLFATASVETRWAFFLESPTTALFIHWFIGTCYMFHFALFVSMCRKIMRSGVLYFIRDPDDPTFHPVRDVLERPIAGQLSKIAFSAFVYGGLVILCLGGVIWALAGVDGLLPINWSTDEPKLELPIDLLFHSFGISILLRNVEPSKKIAAMWAWWFRGCARRLRLSHFLFGEDREEQKGTLIRRTRSAALKVSTEVRPPEEMVEEFFVPDGHYVRAPASDSVRIPKGEHVFVRVDEGNNRIDGVDDSEDGQHGKSNLNFTKVYIPPHFGARIATFIFLMWVFASATGVAFTIGPLILGRHAIAYLAGSPRPHNDLYAFIVGAHLCGGTALAISYRHAATSWLVSKLSPASSALLPHILPVVRRTLASLYIGISFGIILPFSLSLVVETYTLIPLYTYLASLERPTASATPPSARSTSASYTVFALQTWTLGLLYLRLLLRIAAHYPRAATALRSVFRAGWLTPDAALATRALIAPVLLLCTFLLVAPLGFGSLLVALLDVQDAAERVKVARYAYPGLLAAGAAGWSAVLVRRQMVEWRGRIRDEVYLIGERLHNFGEGIETRRKGKGKGRAVEPGPAAPRRVEVEVG